MKTTKYLLSIFFVFTQILIYAQKDQIISDEFMYVDYEYMLYSKSGLSYNNSTEGIENFSFNWSTDFNTSFINLANLELAQNWQRMAWYRKQHELIKAEIERKYNFNNTFPNYEIAKNELFRNIETGNIERNKRPLLSKYENLEISSKSTKNYHLNKLKLLQLREQELNSGNISNSIYGYLDVNNILLKDITSLNQLNQIKSQFESSFATNYWNLEKYQFINTGLKNIGLTFENEVINEKNKLYNKFSDWDRLGFMQFLLNYEYNKQILNCGVCLTPDGLGQFRNSDIATQVYIENRVSNGAPSIFSIWNPQYVIQFSNAYQVNIFQAQIMINQFRITAIQSMLNTVDVSNFAVENLISETKSILNNVNLSDQQKFDQFKIAYNNYDPIQIISTQNDFEIKIKSYIEYFKRRGNNEFADYLSSLLPLESTFSNDDYQKLYETIREQKLNYFYELLREVGLASFDAFKPVIEMALWEVGGTVALKILSKLPIKYLTTPIKNVIARLKAPSSTAFANLKHAKKYGIQSYKNLKTTFDDLGLSLSKEGVERHHLIEVRFFKENPNIAQKLLDKFGKTTDDWLSIIVERGKLGSEHDKFSKAWIQAIGQEGKNGASGIPGWTGKTTKTATFDDVIKAAKEIYKDYPEILKALGI